MPRTPCGFGAAAAAACCFRSWCHLPDVPGGHQGTQWLCIDSRETFMNRARQVYTCE